MKDLISRKAAIKEIQRDRVGCFDPDDFVPEQAERFVISRLSNLPSAQSEIIKCKDCTQIWRSGAATIKGVPTKIYKCRWWDNRVVSENGFCYMAERKLNGIDRETSCN